MRRTLSRFVTAISALACGAVILVWALSFTTVLLHESADPYKGRLSVERGQLTWIEGTRRPLTPAEFQSEARRMPPRVTVSRHELWPLAGLRRAVGIGAEKVSEVEFLDVIMDNGTTAAGEGELGTFRRYAFPIWPVAGILALLPLTTLSMASRERRRAWRIRQGICAKCSYDLRCTSGVCPECGTPVAGKVEAKV